MRWWVRSGWAVVIALGMGLPVAQAQRPKDPDARRTWVAERRKELQDMSPEEREKMRTERHKHRNAERAARPPRPMELRGPLPLPVEVKNASNLGLVGAPAGGACKRDEICTLRLEPEPGQAVIVTAVWSADKIECDGAVSSTPAGGEPIEPRWRCEKSFEARGKGAGYTAFIVAE